MDTFPIVCCLSLRLLLGSALLLVHHLQGKSLPSNRHMLVHGVVISLAIRLLLARLIKGKSLPTTRHILAHDMVVSLAFRLLLAHHIQGKSLPFN